PAFQAACRAMGPVNAAVVIACIFERAEEINSAGAYLRDLSRRACLRQFSAGPMLLALLRSRSRPS
ncbi:MAG: replication initiation protein RepC, partial [Shinella sp.]